MTTKAKQVEQNEAITRLRDEWGIHPGDTIWTVIRHVSASGMSRDIDAYKFGPELDNDGAPVKMWLSYLGAKALGWTFNTKTESVRVGGCGMDMGFHLVYSLSSALFPEGFGCIGERCPSNDHSNGDRDYTPYWHRDIPKPENGITYSPDHWHRDGGYALRQRWI